MASKALLLLALLASAAVLATAAASQQTRHDGNTAEKMVGDAAGVKDDGGGSGSGDQYGHGCEYGCCHRVYHGGCTKCCPPDAGRRPTVKN
ncbi:unnamed protein product [Urochloa decumbens]|uniref:Uncharacterized protein n=1 Tax=Urochloa decumbens TaxID=240449 RepID=A0ABC9CJP8_9POAL